YTGRSSDRRSTWVTWAPSASALRVAAASRRSLSEPVRALPEMANRRTGEVETSVMVLVLSTVNGGDCPAERPCSLFRGYPCGHVQLSTRLSRWQPRRRAQTHGACAAPDAPAAQGAFLGDRHPCGRRPL